jgi:hypothetical protein
MLVQPPHFVAEVTAVIARLEPDYAERLFIAVSNLEMTIEDHTRIYRTAIRLSIDLNHHLFDTLYHAVAIETPVQYSLPPMKPIMSKCKVWDALFVCRITVNKQSQT